MVWPAVPRVVTGARTDEFFPGNLAGYVILFVTSESFIGKLRISKCHSCVPLMSKLSRSKSKALICHQSDWVTKKLKIPLP